MLKLRNLRCLGFGLINEETNNVEAVMVAGEAENILKVSKPFRFRNGLRGEVQELQP
jgi:hypothetical protein